VPHRRPGGVSDLPRARGRLARESQPEMNPVNIVRALSIAGKMLKARGYDVPDCSVSPYFGFIEEKEEQVMVLYLPKAGVGDVRLLLTRMDEVPVAHCLLITDKPWSSEADRTIQNATGVRIENFAVDELQMNIVDNPLVPPHFLLSSKEKAAVLKELGVTLHKLPRMHVRDPMARYYGAARGDVFKITRPSITAGEAVVYRAVLGQEQKMFF